MATGLNEYLENVIDDVGGLGRFQWMLIFLILGSKVAIGWSALMMAFGGVEPDWYCNWKTENGTPFETNLTFPRTCSLSNTSENLVCTSKQFDPEMETVVSEWDLVCGRDWITATITTIQMTGVLIGGFISGHIADTFGRKPTYFLSISMFVVFNGISAFSMSWQMFATLKFLVGIGCGFYSTVYYTFIIEFTPKKYRSMVMALPSWPFWFLTYGLVCMWLHDWAYIQIAVAVASAPWLLGIMFVPESYRWLVTMGKINEAHDVIRRVARWNRKSPPDLNEFTSFIQRSGISAEQKKYTLYDVLKRKSLLKITVCLGICWFSGGYGYYAISFGIQQLSGNLYVNWMLLSAMDVASVAIWYFTNCIGRKWSSFMFFLLGGIAGIVVGVVQFIDIAGKGDIINGFAMTSKLFISCGWATLTVFTSESYPTVVRNIGFGMQNSITRVGAMLAPQLVFASERIPGISYLLFGVLMILSAVSCVFVPETNNMALQDTVGKTKTQPERYEIPVNTNQCAKEKENDTLLEDKLHSYNVEI